ncbi:MAG: Gldg family protein, partial [Chloroflexota bacterium]
HPLLAPLVPRVSDMLEEYRIASNGKVELEIVDPQQDPEKEVEANQTYGINPTPLQAADRYGTSVVNAYFDILVRYGDQFETLNFIDLIEIQPYPSGDVDVRLRNLEYDLTSAIKKVAYGFQSADMVLASLPEAARLTLYATPQSLPEWLATAPATVEKVAREIAGQSNKLQYALVDPDALGSGVTRQQLYDLYGLQPLRSSLFAPDSYYLYMVLQVGDKPQVIYPSGELSEAEVRTAIEAALKRSAAGFLKVVGLWTPPATPTQDMFGRAQQPISSWQELSDTLSQEYEVRTLDLATGQIAPDVDVVLLVGPRGLTDVERYAVDQYLMRGGAVLVAAGNYGIILNPMGNGLALEALEGGLGDLLASYGLTVERSLVLDPQNEPFAVPVVRQVGTFQVQEIQALAFPFFVDVRSNGMSAASQIVSGLQAVTLNWVSPIVVDETKNASRQVTALLKSSPQAWITTDTNIQPNLQTYPGIGFPRGASAQAYTLAVSVQGVFESAFKGQPAPTVAEGSAEAMAPIDTSPESARLVVIGSSEFLNDTIFRISSQLTRDRYLNSLQLAQNAVAWSTEDAELLGIRARGTSTRVLAPMTAQAESFWEGINYAVALIVLVALGLYWSARRRREAPLELLSPDEIARQSQEAGS